MKMTKVFHWVMQHRFGRVVAWFLFSAILLTGTTHAYLTDIAIHLPSILGTYAYNTFMPGAPGFPAVGGTYTDPVFGTTIRRLTDRVGSRSFDDNYSKHQANANGTFLFHGVGTGMNIINAAGTTMYSAQPFGLTIHETHWDALDPDKYYYFSGANLVRRNLAAQTNTTMQSFSSTLQDNGGSLNIQSRDGRYFTVRYGGTNKVWDSQLNVIYANPVTPLSSTGWVTITPDANYLVTAEGPTAMPQKEHYSYAINHGTQSISTTPVQFWGLCGDHGVLVSASNGKTYFVTHQCYDGTQYTSTGPGVWAVDITTNNAGKTPAQQKASAIQLVQFPWSAVNGHMSAVSKGALQDWVFAEHEAYGDDPYNGGVLGWYAYESEIMAINVLTREVRRLAHHRSRGLGDGAYYNQPRTSCAWDESFVMWASNFNISSPAAYADLYGIQ